MWPAIVCEITPLMSDIDDILNKYPFVQRENLIPILQDIQAVHGYLQEEAIERVGAYLQMPTSKIYGLATFYSHFRFEPRGSFHLRLCHGTSCHVKLSGLLKHEIEKLLSVKDGGITKDGKFSFETTNCLGACGHGPVLTINEQVFTHVQVRQIRELIEKATSTEE